MSCDLFFMTIAIYGFKLKEHWLQHGNAGGKFVLDLNKQNIIYKILIRLLQVIEFCP